MKTTGISPLFVECASPDAINAAIVKARRNRDRWDRQMRALQTLLEERTEQIAAGRWPAPPDERDR